MGFTNIAQAGTNRKQERRLRAAVRLQLHSKPYFEVWDSKAQQILETKLKEFLGLVRNGAISQTNVYSAALNILAPVYDVMGRANHQHWLTRFNYEGQREFTDPIWRSKLDRQ